MLLYADHVQMNEEHKALSTDVNQVNLVNDKIPLLLLIAYHLLHVIPFPPSLSLRKRNSFLGALEVIQDDGSAVEKELVGKYVRTLISFDIIATVLHQLHFTKLN